MSAPLTPEEIAEIRARATENLRPGCAGHREASRQHDYRETSHSVCDGCYDDSQESVRDIPRLLDALAAVTAERGEALADYRALAERHERIVNGRDYEVYRDEIAELKAALAAAEAKLAAATILVARWYAEPQNCHEPKWCNTTDGCGASSCFAADLQEALKGESHA